VLPKSSEPKTLLLFSNRPIPSRDLPANDSNRRQLKQAAALLSQLHSATAMRFQSLFDAQTPHISIVNVVLYCGANDRASDIQPQHERGTSVS
jgi:hypothetical protein